MSRLIFIPSSLPQAVTLSQTPSLLWSVKYFMDYPSNIYKAPLSDSVALPTKDVSCMRSDTTQPMSFAYVDFSAWNCFPQSLHLKLLPLSPHQLREAL